MDFFGIVRQSLPRGYQFDMTFDTKAEAKQRAKWLRRHGYYARVIKKKTKHGDYIVAKKMK